MWFFDFLLLANRRDKIQICSRFVEKTFLVWKCHKNNTKIYNSINSFIQSHIVSTYSSEIALLLTLLTRHSTFFSHFRSSGDEIINKKIITLSAWRRLQRSAAVHAGVQKSGFGMHFFVVFYGLVKIGCYQWYLNRKCRSLMRFY